MLDSCCVTCFEYEVNSPALSVNVQKKIAVVRRSFIISVFVVCCKSQTNVFKKGYFSQRHRFFCRCIRTFLDLRVVSDFFQRISDLFIATSIMEWVAFSFGVLYVVLMAWERTAAWTSALISSLAYVYVCFTTDLFLESFLQLFYAGMGIYGWFSWSKRSSEDWIPIRWRLKNHLVFLLIGLVLSFVVGLFFDLRTAQANPYMDAGITVFSLTATFLSVKKVVENWYYWLVIDAFSFYLYGSQALYVSALLFLIYMVFSVVGLVKWRGRMTNELKLKN
jgi:nicotinamide mononucleotide transporter